MDFAVLPPEVNSAQMYGGAGSGPLFAAAAAWDGLGADLSGAASTFDALISGLAGGPWTGPASAAMAATAAGYLGWLSAAAALAEGSAAQARVAAAAFEAALAATVHPMLVEDNRLQFLTLVATNFLGLNTPAIAATEFEYVEMWAQDVAAMGAYCSQALSAATQLIPFAAIPLDAVGIALTAESVAATVGPPLQGAFQAAQLLASPAMMAIQPAMMAIGAATQAGSGGGAAMVGATMPEGATGLGVGAAAAESLKPMGGGAGLGAAANLGQARMVGALSVPPSWPGATPAGMSSSALSGLASLGLPNAALAAEANAAAAAGGGMPMMPMPMGGGAQGGMPAGMMAGRGGGAPHVVQSRPSVIPRTGV
ncbi:PPE family protein [Mycobacterium intermedium]|uniref:PPE family protein n=1 Tax=Mycobacterium intermedium TaxID=28445 RepID=A0A1E3S933_MYCIE|nr:PPE family protein [Mycobacterium intermedium]MCV6967829.1 PPE family protein [Mycobacterium intermedium]ODQ98649.1 hypothetical protein BHQ20_20880 [Mycobacterium intermedium]OPE50826.1 PPE family protein [Mycobacterium intermedium]ORB06594.1 PPE family protein [Mycobacterium intermedium]